MNLDQILEAKERLNAEKAALNEKLAAFNNHIASRMSLYVAKRTGKRTLALKTLSGQMLYLSRESAKEVAENLDAILAAMDRYNI